MNNTIITLVQSIAQQLKPIYKNTEEQQQTAWWLLQNITGKTKSTLIAQNEISLADEQTKQLNDWISQHVNDLKPLQYILGSVPFLSLEILVKPPTLIPRPETEEWCVNLITTLQKLKNRKINILDLCTGSGCIALALAQALPQATVVGTDISEQALSLAGKNAAHNHLKNVTFVKSDIYNTLPKKTTFDVIVSNPPYITDEEWAEISPSVSAWEDKKALHAPDEGLAIIKSIINGAQGYLHSNPEIASMDIPQLIIEIGYRQADSVKKLMQEAGFKNVQVTKDLAGKDRIVSGGL